MEIDNTKPDSKEEENKLTKVIGELGKWQVIMILVIQFPTFMIMAWMQLGIIFLAPKTSFICIDKNITNVETPLRQKCYDGCDKYEYYTEFRNTIISQWDLICDRAWMVQFSQTILMFGTLIGSTVFGFISDRYGRRISMLIISMVHLCASMSVAFCPTYWTFIAVRFFIGMTSGGGAVCASTFNIEITGPNKLEMVNSLIGVAVAIGTTTMPIFSYFLRTYDMFSLGVAVPSIIYLLYFFIMPESPKWLISMNRLDEATVVMEKAAKWNNMPSANILDVAKSIASENQSSESQEHATYLDLFRSKLLKYTLCCFTIWLMSSIIFDGGNQFIGLTSANPFISMCTAGALQIPGAILSAVLCKYIGRRFTLISLWIMCSIMYALLAVYNDWVYFKLVVGSIALTCVAGAFCCLYLFTLELFPTVTRNMAIGASYAVSGVGSMLAPFISGLAVEAVWIPPTVFAIAPVIASLVCCCLPETKGKKLSDHLA